MNDEPIQVSNEKSDDDRDSPRDPALGQLLRRYGPDGPSMATDKAILAAAQAELAPPVTRRGWPRWHAPLAMAATLTLAVALSLTMDRQASITADTATPSVPSDPSATPARTEASRTADAPSSSEASAKREAKTTTTTGRPVASSAPSVSAEPPAPQAKRPVPALASPPAANDMANARGKESAKSAKIAPASRTGNERRAASKGSAPTAAPLAEHAPTADAMADQRMSTPEAWLEKIRRLKQTGRQEEATRQLAEFRRHYPDYPLPENF